MSNLENLFQQYKYITEIILNKHYEKDQVKDLLAFIDTEYHHLIPSDATIGIIPKDVNQKMHVVTPCLVIAINRALKYVITPSFSLGKLIYYSDSTPFS